MSRYLICDIATTAIDGAAEYLEVPSAPANYKDPVKIAAYIEEKQAENLTKIALDPDLGRITAIGVSDDGLTEVMLCKDEAAERKALLALKMLIWPSESDHPTQLIGFNALRFDWPFLLRRALYLGVRLNINLDRYRTPHVDLFDRLTHHGLVTGHALAWYAKRLGWRDLVKPLSGAEEAQVPASGKWDELELSVKHDLEATRRMAEWMGVLQPSKAEAEVA